MRGWEEGQHERVRKVRYPGLRCMRMTHDSKEPVLPRVFKARKNSQAAKSMRKREQMQYTTRLRLSVMPQHDDMTKSHR